MYLFRINSTFIAMVNHNKGKRMFLYRRKGNWEKRVLGNSEQNSWFLKERFS